MVRKSAVSYEMNAPNSTRQRGLNRNSTLEILRIICMFLVILHHFVVHGGALGMEPCFNKVLASFILPVGKIAFTCFIFISMWFFVDQKFRADRFLRTWLEVLFYSVLVFVLSVQLGAQAGFTDVLGALLPIGGNTHGFAAAYLAFYLLLPLLSRASYGLTKRQVSWVVCILFYIQVFETILGGLNLTNLVLHPFSSEITLFVLCYFAALYLKRWPPTWSNLPGVMGLVFLCIWAFIFMMNWASWQIPSETASSILSLFAADESSLLYLIGGLALFLCFNSLPATHIAFVNTLASTTFAVLLIHDHNFFRGVLWTSIVNVPSLWYSRAFPFYMISVSIIIFISCSVIDILRQRLVEIRITKSLTYKCIAKKLDSIWSDNSDADVCNADAVDRGVL